MLAKHSTTELHHQSLLFFETRFPKLPRLTLNFQSYSLSFQSS